jgi:predicted O-methyltransferase YrrM
VETGVANGFSSASILQALEGNQAGELYSIGLHCRKGVTTPVSKELGWVIPEHLKHRWHLILGESFRVLPRLLEELGTIDIFLHDSRHTYKTMMKEYTIVWPHLHRGGLLLSHDVKFNDAYLDFCDKVGYTRVVISDIGAIAK